LDEDITGRCYPFWASRAVEQKEDLTKEDDSAFTEEAIDQTVRFFEILFVSGGKGLNLGNRFRRCV
jgi:hypothetical protein